MSLNVSHFMSFFSFLILWFYPLVQVDDIVEEKKLSAIDEQIDEVM